MPISSWKEAGQFIKRQVPDVFIKRRFNFITIHYLYMTAMALLSSVIIYGIGDMHYIDALFFASGACTQSGLNTLDVNLISTGQQFVLYLDAMLCNPIVINSTVVFIRLYWFEKRFKDVVRDARALRRTKSRSRNNTQMREDLEDGPPDRGVKGKVIEILRNTGKIIEGNTMDEKMVPAPLNGSSLSSSDDSKRNSHERSNDQPLPVISHGDQMTAVEQGGLRVPHQLSPDQNLRFLEQQRNPTDEITLRIPSPREFDRGGKPEDVGHNGDEALTQQLTASPVELRPQTSSDGGERLNAPHVPNHITIDEPTISRPHDKTMTYPRVIHRHGTDPPPSDISRISHTKSRANTFNSFRRTNTPRPAEAAPYLSYEPTIGRNSFFVNLTEEQREELGGIEYRALKTLALVLVSYFFAFHLFAVVCLVPWIMKSKTYGPIVTKQGQGRPWWGIFTAASAFNDLGFTLTNDSMIEFGTAVFPMLLMTILIVVGNTGFPCALRFVIWLCSLCVPKGSAIWEEFVFLLDHPRRCFTLLFPRAATWWLFAVLVILNGLDLIFFIVLDLNDSVVTSMPPFIRFVDGLFQASSTRTAGFAVVNLAELHPAIQVSYLVMMYISVFPIAISMRRTNVYEEKSLGIYGGAGEDENEQEPSYVGAHLRKQLSFDLWYLFLGLFIVAVAEGTQLQDPNKYAFSLFACLFEIVSAYGTVGLSLGYPTINASFSAEFGVISKLVIIAMQIRGRHRGLPYELDRAILLPSEGMHQQEIKESQRLMARRRSSLAQSSLAQSAVEGMIESDRFRPETGLSTGMNAGHNQARERANTTKTQASAGSLGDSHQSHLRSGLGNGMFKLASAPDVIKESVEGSNEKNE